MLFDPLRVLKAPTYIVSGAKICLHFCHALLDRSGIPPELATALSTVDGLTDRLQFSISSPRRCCGIQAVSTNVLFLKVCLEFKVFSNFRACIRIKKRPCRKGWPVQPSLQIGTHSVFPSYNQICPHLGTSLSFA